jgi:hypothetical protein
MDEWEPCPARYCMNLQRLDGDNSEGGSVMSQVSV